MYYYWGGSYSGIQVQVITIDVPSTQSAALKIAFDIKEVTHISIRVQVITIDVPSTQTAEMKIASVANYSYCSSCVSSLGWIL